MIREEEEEVDQPMAAMTVIDEQESGADLSAYPIVKPDMPSNLEAQRHHYLS